MAVPVPAARENAVAALADHLEGLRPGPARADQATRRIGTTVLAASPNLGSSQFEEIAPEDLWLMFHAYDRHIFGGLLAGTLGSDPRQHLKLRLSSRMTSAGGKALAYRGGSRPRFEIAVSSHLLFTNFAPGETPVQINGLACGTRLQALQRIFEHELVHLVELLLWGRSSCRRPRFRALAHTLFGHTGVTHRLATPGQRALQEHGLRPGDPVRFRFEDQHLEGFVNRITKRATVLVPDPAGRRYTDGGTYTKFYVPVEELRRL